MFRFFLPFIGALLVFIALQEMPHNSKQLEKQRIIWEDWEIQPLLYKAGKSGVLFLNFVKLTDTPAPLPENGYNVTLKAGEDIIPIAESVTTFDDERLFYVVPALENDAPLSVTVKVGNQPLKELEVTPHPISPVVTAAMLGDAEKLKKITSNMEDSADKFFYTAIADELQHNPESALNNYKKALDLTTYRKNEMPNMLLFKRYEALSSKN